MVQRALAAIARTVRGIGAAIAQTVRGTGAAVRAGARIVWCAAAAVLLFSLAAPVAVLSLARQPPDSFTLNPWLPRLPDFLASSETWSRKLSFVSGMALAWVSADTPGEGVDWSFVVDVPTLFRIGTTSLIFGTWFALWAYRRRQGAAGFPAARPAGIAGAVTSVIGLGTGPCTLAGCGAPVLPVVGLAFTGLSSGALALFSAVSSIGSAVILAGMSLAIVWFGWNAGARTSTS